MLWEKWIYTVPLRIRSLFRRREVEQELEEELRDHLEQQIRENMARGMNPEEAKYAARRAIGGMELQKEKCRDTRRVALVEDLWQDICYGVRVLGRTPVITAVAILSLALGIGANSAIFSMMDAVLLRLLPVRNPQELVLLLLQEPEHKPGDGFTNALWESVRDHQEDVFQEVFAWSGSKPFSSEWNGNARTVEGLFVSGSYFSTLGVNAVKGRLITDMDDRPGCAPVAVLSYGFWKTVGHAEDVLGSTLSLYGQSFQVIGVSAPRFYGVEVGKKFDVAVPICASGLFDRRNTESRSRWWLSIIGRVRPGIAPAQLKARLEAISPGVMNAALQDSDADTQRQQRFLSTKLVSVPASIGTSELRDAFGQALRVLMVIVALVMLIACANIASLTLARGRARGKELAVRKAVGAARGRLVRQLLTESVLLSFAGAGLGVVFAKWSSALLVRQLVTARDDVFLDLSINARVLGFTALSAILTAILVGLLPAFRSTKIEPIEAMKARTGVGGAQGFRASRWIVSGQVALTLVLLIGGGLLLRSFVRLVTQDLGFDRSNVLVVSATPPWFAVDTAKEGPEKRTIIYEEMERRLRALPEVISISRAFTTPIGGDNWLQAIHTDAHNAPTGDEAAIYLNVVGPGYFETLHSPLLQGRDFDERDSKNSLHVGIVNETAARKFFSGRNVLGRHFWLGGEPKQVEIVGVVKDSKYERVREVVPPTVFIPTAQVPSRVSAEEFVLRTRVEPTTLIESVRRTAAQVSNDIPLKFRTLADQVDDDLVQERLLAGVSGFLGGLGLLLAMIGLFGAVSYLVTQRQTEFGVRMALGAQPESILRLVLRELLVILVVGLAAGIGVGLTCARALQSLLFGLPACDAFTMVGAIGVLSTMALVAGYLPARRAMRVDPMVALRYE
jgi:putative ABC transport system permease protein